MRCGDGGDDRSGVRVAAAVAEMVVVVWCGVGGEEKGGEGVGCGDSRGGVGGWWRPKFGRSVRKQVQIFASKPVFTLPCEIGTSPRIPSNFDDRNATLLQLFDFPVHNLYRLLNEVKFVIDLDIFKWDDE
ncbi:hypothetical protein Tco_0823744 [Tanacetum coccineum]|uniref:Uncharacterized protein n=1 Tax=Tanacetum coccineum TaxID=301880 RepID=A0ABQ5AIS7_9ASTR